jgi:Protein of unknown function (DUF3147)
LEYFVRFLIGGAVVSIFAVVGDVLRPKSFAGLFGAAPSVALATLALAFAKHGADYVALEGRSMLLGAIALMLYSIVICQLMVCRRTSALTASVCTMIVWLTGALALKFVFLGAA